MAARHDHAAVPFVARQRDELRVVGERLGRDPEIGFGLRDELRDLARVALVQQQPHFWEALGELLDRRRQHVARLRVRRRDRQRAFVVSAVLVADSLQLT